MSELPKVIRDWYSALGKKGGAVSTPKKAEAVRKNGRLGGRPRKKPLDQK